MTLCEKIVIENKVVELINGNIAEQDTEAVVNAANTSLLGGGGVDGAIHRAAGPELLEYCKTLGGCRTGEAKITPGFNLKSKYIIHTVGPVYRDGKHGEAELLARCYQNSLELAVKEKIKSLSFPSISTGAYRYPFQEASEIALQTVLDFLKSHPYPELVRFVLFGEEGFNIYKKTLSGLCKVENWLSSNL